MEPRGKYSSDSDESGNSNFWFAKKKYAIDIFKWYCYRLPIGFTTIHELHSLSENPLTYVCKRDLGEYPIQRWQHMATITSRMAMTAAMHNPYEATPFPFPCVAPIWALAIKKWISKLHMYAKVPQGTNWPSLGQARPFHSILSHDAASSNSNPFHDQHLMLK